MPRRISLSSTRAQRFLIASMSLTVLNNDHGEVILKLAAAGQASGRLQLIDQRPAPEASGGVLDPVPARVLPDAIAHGEDEPGGSEVGVERDEERFRGTDRRV